MAYDPPVAGQSHDRWLRRIDEKWKWMIESGRQMLAHIEIHNIAVNELRMEVQDLFVLTQKNRPVIRFSKFPQHARKNHSYLWVFRKQA